MRFVLGLLPWVSSGKDWKRIWWTMLTMKSETYTSRNRDMLRVVGGDVVEWRKLNCEKIICGCLASLAG
jgi:hypothetical protein